MNQDRRTFVGAMAALPLLGGVARAQTPPVRVAIETAAGTITVELYGDKAPITVANFLRYVDEKRFDGAEFYRTVRLEALPNAGLLQGGCHGDPKRLLPPIAHEPTSQTGLRHKVDTLSMPRRGLGPGDGELLLRHEEAH